MPHPNRKPMRLKNYDYAQNGAYFITICTKDRQSLFWNPVVGADIIRPQNENTNPTMTDVIRRNDVTLTEYGKIAENAIKSIPIYYPYCTIDKYVVMPDHIHMILILNEHENGRIISAPTTVSTIIGQMKRYVSKEIGFFVWQKSYYDHVIHNEDDYITKWNYIENNPVNFLKCEVNPNDQL